MEQKLRVVRNVWNRDSASNLMDLRFTTEEGYVYEVPTHADGCIQIHPHDIITSIVCYTTIDNDYVHIVLTYLNTSGTNLRFRWDTPMKVYPPKPASRASWWKQLQ